MSTAPATTYTIKDAAALFGRSRHWVHAQLAANATPDGQRSAIVVGGVAVPALRLGAGGHWAIVRPPLDRLLSGEVDEAAS